ncbi:MAG: hypothetical protein R2764_18715 [Bacteroidales bacterium]
MKKTFIASTVIIIFLGVFSAKAQVSIDLESGAVFTGYNDVRIPGDQGTLFSLKDDLKSKSSFFYRGKTELYHKIPPHTLFIICPFGNKIRRQFGK